MKKKTRREFRGLPRKEVERLERQAEQLERRGKAQEEANSDPLPGPLKEALLWQPRTIGGLTVRKFVHYDHVILRQINSPLFKHLAEIDRPKGKRKNTPYTDQDGYEMILQFTRPVRDVAAILARGRATFRQTAVEEIGMVLSSAEIEALVHECIKSLLQSVATIVKHKAENTSEKTEVFIQPPAEQKMGSAGGLITSAG